MKQYVQRVAGSSNVSDEIPCLHDLGAEGAVTPEEYQQANAKLLA